MSIPPPRGMNEVDYETIEAAVTETVRGRWFLAEFARRNRLAETRQLLDAMARLEATVGQASLPSADPSIRLLVQRIKEIAAALGGVVGDLREAGVEDHLVDAVDAQARAVSGLMRAATPSLGKPSEPRPLPPPTEPALAPIAEIGERRPAPAPARDPLFQPHRDQRLAALAALDALPLGEKLALFR